MTLTGGQVEVLAIATLTAVACAVTGTFLVLRRVAMLSDAISHAVLLGIVVAFLAVRDLGSPLLLVGAAATGLLTVLLVEALVRTGRVRQDASIGLVFPALFSIGVILVSRFAGDVHLDTDAVLLGELAFAPLDRLVVAGTDLGPRAMWEMAAILLADVAFVLLFYKELKLTTFDAGLAAAFGFAPAAMHYGLMALVSVTAVGAFDAVGSVLVVALMVAPPAAAWMIANSLPAMIGLSAAFGAVAAVTGHAAARELDASIAGSMAAAAGLVFAAAFLVSPSHGVLAAIARRRRQRWAFAEATLAVHLLQHQDRPEAAEECRADRVHRHLEWDAAFTGQVVRRAVRRGMVARTGPCLGLTAAGRSLAREYMGL
ncbi:MAG: metal ABC transporter permease [Deltaproteobacteria bacterium]|nr:metal ABC transporter permease [Deltaproteobacteria bacterium]